MINAIDRHFGTWRGLARTVLGYAELASGRLRRFALDKEYAPTRIVFVCQGNICRSAFAEALACNLGIPAVSIGLSTSTGTPSPLEAVDAARRLGVDLSRHRALAWEDFDVRPGDLFLAMEIRQVHELCRRLAGRPDVSVSLLGFWCRPVMPHLHDPFSLNAWYFDRCLARIECAVHHLRDTVVVRSARLAESTCVTQAKEMR